MREYRATPSVWPVPWLISERRDSGQHFERVPQALHQPTERKIPDILDFSENMAAIMLETAAEGGTALTVASP